MIKKIVGGLSTILLALAVLLVSIIESTTPKYAYSPMVLSQYTENKNLPTIEYVMPYEGKIMPDNILWPAKALRDRFLYTFSFSNSRKSELSLMFADKRVNSSLYLFKSNKPDLGVSTLIKSGQYLEKSEVLIEDPQKYEQVALAALKHREIIENEILPLSPEDIKPEVNKALNYSKRTYNNMQDKMKKIGLVAPTNPFETK